MTVGRLRMNGVRESHTGFHSFSDQVPYQVLVNVVNYFAILWASSTVFD